MVHNAVVTIGAIVYGVSIINIPIGLVGYAIFRRRQRNATNQNTRRDAMDAASCFLLSAIPIVGPAVALLISIPINSKK